MFTVELYAKIRHAVMIDGLSRREAAKRFGVHRNTITKMLSFSVPPGYRRRERPTSKKLGPYLAWIDAILEGDSQVHKKQRHTAHRIFERLRDEQGFTGGYSIDQPLAVAPRDIPNTFTDIAASTVLANLCTDAFRAAREADIGFTANGMMRAGLTRGKSGVQTVYDVFAVAPLGAGVVDPTAGSTLVTGYFTGEELKHLLEFFLVDNSAHPGEYFPRASGMRFR
jgi:transposase